MAETLQTKDGKIHTLLGSTTLESIIRDYAGDEAADRVARLNAEAVREQLLAETDLTSYESSLDSQRSAMQDCIDALDELLLHSNTSRKYTREIILREIEEVRNQLYSNT